MKKKELNQIKNLSSEELLKKANELRDKITKVRMDIISGKEKNNRKGRNLRHELAQILTIKTIIDRSEEKKEGASS